MTVSEKVREKIHWIAEEASHGNWQSFESRLAELILDYESRIQELVQSTPRNQDIAALIQEMKHGFQTIDKRFEFQASQTEKQFQAMDKRFDDLIHQMDKRFDDLIHQMDKRFEQMNKRFDDLIHQMDKRFEQVDKRFSMMFWMMGIGFTFFSLIIAYGTFFKV